MVDGKEQSAFDSGSQIKGDDQEFERKIKAKFDAKIEKGEISYNEQALQVPLPEKMVE